MHTCVWGVMSSFGDDSTGGKGGGLLSEGIQDGWGIVRWPHVLGGEV